MLYAAKFKTCLKIVETTSRRERCHINMNTRIKRIYSSSSYLAQQKQQNRERSILKLERIRWWCFTADLSGQITPSCTTACGHAGQKVHTFQQIEALTLVGVLGLDRLEKVLQHAAMQGRKFVYLCNRDVFTYVESYSQHILLLRLICTLPFKPQVHCLHAFCHLWQLDMPLLVPIHVDST